MDIGIDGVLRSGGVYEVGFASGKVQCLYLSPPLNGKIGWFTIYGEFNDYREMVILGEFLRDRRVNH
jgi:hypothetical protein